MGPIVCAIRGGPYSWAALDHAIEMARQSDRRLAFLHVVEESLVGLHAGVRSEAVLHELRDLGEFMVAMAQERAAAAGVEADCAVRVGDVPDEIIKYVRECNADILVLGNSRHGLLSHLLHGDRLDEFVRRVERETSAQVVIAPPPVSDAE